MSAQFLGDAVPKGFTRGTHRARPPRETLDEYEPLMSKMGITRLANLTGLDRVGIPVYTAIRPNSRGLTASQGKGLEPISAKVSALMESIETWHAERIALPIRYESLVELQRVANVADVVQIPRKTVAPLRRDMSMMWVEGHDLLGKQPIWVPLDAVSTNFAKQGAGLAGVFFQSSNGLASGNTLAEATLHGLYEVIERDALSLYMQEDAARQKPRQIDLETVDDPGCREVLERLRNAEVVAAAWDITSDTGIPCFAATIIDDSGLPRWRPMGAFSGYGCHSNPGIALLRALTEAVQSRVTMIAGSRDDLFPAEYADCRNLDDQKHMLEQFRTPPPSRAFSSQEDRSGSSFGYDMDLVLAGLRGAGITQAIVVDLSREELGIPVVKVVVPGLEGFALARSYQPGQRALRVRERPAS